VKQAKLDAAIEAEKNLAQLKEDSAQLQNMALQRAETNYNADMNKWKNEVNEDKKNEIAAAKEQAKKQFKIDLDKKTAAIKAEADIKIEALKKETEKYDTATVADYRLKLEQAEKPLAELESKK